MLFLIFNVAEKRYAIHVEQIIEVLPNLISGKLDSGEPKYFAGIIDYHGMYLPVVDLCQLLNDRPCPNMLSSRIILIKSPFKDQNLKSIALLAEKVTETMKIQEAPDLPPDTPQFKEKIEAQLSQSNSIINLFSPSTSLPDNLNQLLDNL